MLSRQKNTNRAGTTPRPRDRRQTARRWFSPNLPQVPYRLFKCKLDCSKTTHIQNKTKGTKAETTNPKSIIVSGGRNKGKSYSMSVAVPRQKISHLSPGRTTCVGHVCECPLVLIAQMQRQTRMGILHLFLSPKGNYFHG
jgi:hypothetical protein